MTTVNTALAEILERPDQGTADSGDGPLIAALLDGGVFVPVDAKGSVVFLAEDEGPGLPGYVSAECLAEDLPEAAGAVHCDAMRLHDILRQTKAVKMIVSSPAGWAKIPSDMLLDALRQGTRLTEGRSVMLGWSTRPLALALRDALRARLLDFPGIETVWIADACWEHSGVEQLLVHLAVGADAPPEAASRLMEAVMSEDVTVGDGDPAVASIVLDPVAQADQVRHLDSLGLDTLRADHARRRVEVVSREFDAAPPPPAPEPRPRRWWRRP
ncbi:hypothetical protein [Streptomyces sp. ICC4]|uniref:hypothetical protein n=1 Tax=Streptomyces sp. ICC4 TaxID=2099584 RepID=UPI0013A6A9B2|nr:hypothetical protein [Streptomyces sp. ICC4]